MPASTRWLEGLLAVLLGLTIVIETVQRRSYPRPTAPAVLTARLDFLEVALMLALAGAVLYRNAAPETQRTWRRHGAVALAAVVAALAARLLGVGSLVREGLLGVAVLSIAAALIRVDANRPTALVAIGLRVILVFGLSVVAARLGSQGVVFDDEVAYNYAAKELVEMADGGLRELSVVWWHLQGHFLSVLTTLYWVFGADPLVMRLVGVLLGSVIALFAAEMTRARYGRGPALVVGLILAALPTLAVWSDSLLKESLVLLTVLLAVGAATSWDARWWVRAAFLLGCFHILIVGRPYVALALLATILAAALIRFVRGMRQRHNDGPLAIVLITLLALPLVAWLAVPQVMETLSPNAILYRRVASSLHVPTDEEFAALGLEGEPANRVAGGPVVIARVPGEPLALPVMIVMYGPGDTVVVNVDNRRYVRIPMADTFDVNSRTPLAPPANGVPASAAPARDDLWAAQQLLSEFGSGLLVATFAPLNTGLGSLPYYWAAVESLIWIAALVSTTINVFWRRDSRAAFLFTFAIIIICVNALIPGSPGNLIRQRTVTALPTMLLAGAPVLYQLALLLRARLPIAMLRRPLQKSSAS